VTASHIQRQTHLESQAGLDLIGEAVCDCLVKVDENLHGKLGLDSALGDQVVERVCKGTAQTVPLSASAL
jgi:hypothetical protein